MRIECSVRTLNKATGARNPNCYFPSTLALGKETGTDNDYFLLHLQNINRGQMKSSRFTKYPLKSNPTKIYNRFIDEGRITIAFTEPLHDLFIQALPEELHRFLLVFNVCLSGQVGALKPTPISTEAVEKYGQCVPQYCGQPST